MGINPIYLKELPGEATIPFRMVHGDHSGTQRLESLSVALGAAACLLQEFNHKVLFQPTAQQIVRESFLHISL